MEQIRSGCAMRGGLFAGEVNRFAGGTAWFLGGHGVYRFDGTDWHYQNFAANPQLNGGVLLAVAVDGRMAIAVDQSAAFNRSAPSFWVFQNGRWREHSISAQSAAARRSVRRINGQSTPVLHTDLRSLAVAADGTIFMLTTDDQCRRFDLDGNEIAASPAGLQFGSVSQLLQDESGRIFLASKDISDGASARAGLAIIAADGKATLLSAAEFDAFRWSARPVCIPKVYSTPSGKQAVRSTRPANPDGARLRQKAFHRRLAPRQLRGCAWHGRRRARFLRRSATSNRAMLRSWSIRPPAAQAAN